MIDWTKSMIQTFEYYRVNPDNWQDEKPITSILSSSIDRDSESETLGSASLTTTELLGECYIRIYLVINQNGINNKIPLGTYLVQTPSFSFDGKIKNISIDGYTPLIELKEKQPPIGYFIPKDRNVMESVYEHIKQNLRAPVVKTNNNETVAYDFVSNTSDTWMSYIKDLSTSVNYIIGLDELGRVIFEPKKTVNALAPSWIYSDGNSSILYSDISLDNDLYGIPNIVEVIYSTDEYYFNEKVINDDIDSPTSIQSRGREIIHRIINPEISGTPNSVKIRRYAEDVLKEMSSIECRITYTHGYCPVKLGDCVILNYKRSGISNVKARVIKQNISCVPGTPVEETAVFNNKLWGGLDAG